MKPMNAPFSNNELRFALPTDLRFSAADGHRDAAEAHVATGQALARRLADALAYVATFFRHGAVLAELRGMSDHELADIGLSRGQVHRVFDPAFAREHSRYR
jgi:uncharacterized protein YjiS (DUF1127 family)